MIQKLSMSNSHTDFQFPGKGSSSQTLRTL